MWRGSPFTRRGFAARLSQWDCEKVRERVPPRFGGGNRRALCEEIRGKPHNCRVSGPILVRNLTSGSGSILRALRAQNPRFEKSKRGKFEREFFARG